MARRIVFAALIALGVCGGAMGQVPVRHRLPNGTVVDMGSRKQSGEAERQRMNKRCREELTAAEKALADGKWHKAWRSLKLAAALATDQGQADHISRLLGKLEDEGQKLIRQADQACNSGKYAQAVQKYTVVSRRFGALPSAAAARKSLKDIASDPVAQEVLQEAKAVELEKLVNRILARHLPKAEANSVLSVGRRPTTQPSDRVDLIKAIPPEEADSVINTLWRIVKMYPLCPTARRAKADLKSLKADKTFQASMKRFRDRRKARGLLQRAQAFAGAGLADKAMQDFKEIIRLYPDTPEARDARRMLTGANPGARK